MHHDFLKEVVVELDLRMSRQVGFKTKGVIQIAKIYCGKLGTPVWLRLWVYTQLLLVGEGKDVALSGWT